MLSEKITNYLFQSFNEQCTDEKSLIMNGLYMKYRKGLYDKYGFSINSDPNLVFQTNFIYIDPDWECDYSNVFRYENNELLEQLSEICGINYEFYDLGNYACEMENDSIDYILDSLQSFDKDAKKSVLKFFDYCKDFDYPYVYIFHDYKYGLKKKLFLKSHNMEEFNKLKKYFKTPFYDYFHNLYLENDEEEIIFTLIGCAGDYYIDLEMFNINFLEAKVIFEESSLS